MYNNGKVMIWGSETFQTSQSWLRKKSSVPSAVTTAAATAESPKSSALTRMDKLRDHNNALAAELVQIKISLEQKTEKI